jgi:hypothetical protein
MRRLGSETSLFESGKGWNVSTPPTCGPTRQEVQNKAAHVPALRYLNNSRLAIYRYFHHDT